MIGKILLCMLGVILVLLLIALRITAYVRVSYEQGKLHAFIKYAWITIPLFPKKEKEAAQNAYSRYQSALIGMRHHILGDIALLFFTIFAMLIPYGALQLSEAPFSLPALICYGIAAGVFSGVMILSYALFLGPLQQKKAEALNDLCDAYNAALPSGKRLLKS